MPRLPWHVSPEWGGGFTIRHRNPSGGEWIIAYLREREPAELIVEAVNVSAVGRTPVQREREPWVCMGDKTGRYTIRREGSGPNDWPIAVFNRREDVALAIKALKSANVAAPETASGR